VGVGIRTIFKVGLKDIFDDVNWIDLPRGKVVINWWQIRGYSTV